MWIIIIIIIFNTGYFRRRKKQRFVIFSVIDSCSEAQKF